VVAVHFGPVELANAPVPRVRRAIRDATDACCAVLRRHLGFGDLNFSRIASVTAVHAVARLFNLDKLGAHLSTGQASGLGLSDSNGRCLGRVLVNTGERWRGKRGGKSEGGNVFDIHEICSDVLKVVRSVLPGAAALGGRCWDNGSECTF